MLPHYKLTTC